LQNLTICWYDSHENKWIPQASIVDSMQGTVSIKIDHLSSYALIAEPRIKARYFILTGALSLALAILWKRKRKLANPSPKV